MPAPCADSTPPSTLHRRGHREPSARAGLARPPASLSAPVGTLPDRARLARDHASRRSHASTRGTPASTAAPTAACGLPRHRRLNSRVSWRSFLENEEQSMIAPTADEWCSMPARICISPRDAGLGCSIPSRRFSPRLHDLTTAKTIRRPTRERIFNSRGAQHRVRRNRPRRRHDPHPTSLAWAVPITSPRRSPGHCLRGAPRASAPGRRRSSRCRPGCAGDRRE